MSKLPKLREELNWQLKPQLLRLPKMLLENWPKNKQLLRERSKRLPQDWPKNKLREMLVRLLDWKRKSDKDRSVLD